MNPQNFRKTVAGKPVNPYAGTYPTKVKYTIRAEVSVVTGAPYWVVLDSYGHVRSVEASTENAETAIKMLEKRSY